jgi:ABC-type branched-subunit amino acid transport system substrate-binding protein
MKRRKSWWAIGVAVALAVGVTTAGTSGLAGAQSSTRGVTGDSIKVAGMLSKQFFGDAEKGAAARFDRENAKGGVFGRTIDMGSAADDNFDPNTNIQEARRLVTQEKVFAIVPTANIVLASANFLEQQKVPFLGWGIDASFCDHEYAYGWSGCVGGGSDPQYSDGFNFSALAKMIGEPTKGLTAALVAEDTDAARTGNKTQASAAKDMGVKVTYNEAVIPAPPATVGDFTPFVQDIMTSNDGGPPDMALLYLASIPATLGLQNGLRDAGFEGPIMNTQTYDPQLAAPSNTGSVYVQFGAFETADTVPAVKTMLDDLEAADVAPTVLAAAGWLSADMFIEALKKTGKNLTIENFQKAANKLTYKRTGLVGPTPLGDKPRPSPCGTLVTSNGTGYDVSVPYFCAKAYPYPSKKK